MRIFLGGKINANISNPITLTILSVLFFLFSSLDLSAQEQEETVTWKGNACTDVANGNTRVFLYNVGLGKFLMIGGEWGIQPRLFYEDLGVKLKISIIPFDNKHQYYNHYYIKTDIESAQAERGNELGLNPPGLTLNQQYNTTNRTIIIFDATSDAASNNWWRQGWEFNRVEDTSNTETYTYYLTQDIAKGSESHHFYFGAAYGASKGNYGYNHARLDRLDSDEDDKAAYTTIDVTGAAGEQEVTIFENTQVPIKELYQWRIVTEEDIAFFIDNVALGSGLHANISYKIPDQDFARLNSEFYNGWTVSRDESSVPSANEEGNRWKYTYGTIDGKSTNNILIPYNSGKQAVDEPWYYPVRLKEEFSENMDDGKYGFMSFEGIGSVHSSITAPATGWYLLTCYGFCISSDENREAFIYAKSDENTAETRLKTFVNRISGANNININLANKKNRNDQRNAGKELTFNSSPGIDYKVSLMIYAEGNSPIEFGVKKNDATRSAADSTDTNNNKVYYHDTDWVGVDNFQISYLGEQAIRLDESQESLDYIPDGSFSDITIFMTRTLTPNSWNTFVSPIPLTTAQVKSAFGENTRLAVLDGLGSITGSATCIDFKTVQLPAEGNAIEKGKFYLINPTKAMTTGTIRENDAFIETSFYNLGRHLFKKDESFSVMDMNKYVAASSTATGAEGHNTISTYATYVATSNYDNFNKGDIPENGVYVPDGSYVLDTEGKMHHTKNTMRIKGFRGWIQDDPENSFGPSKISLDGIFDESVDGIIHSEWSKMPTDVQDNRVYNTKGQMVGKGYDLNSLPRGLYITNGKKMIVK